MINVHLSANSTTVQADLTAAILQLQTVQVRPYIAPPVVRGDTLILEGTLNSTFGIWTGAMFAILATSLYDTDPTAVDTAYDLGGSGMAVVWSYPTRYGYTILLFGQTSLSAGSLALSVEFSNPASVPLAPAEVTIGNSTGFVGPTSTPGFFTPFPRSQGFRKDDVEFMVTMGQTNGVDAVTGRWELRVYNSEMPAYNGFEAGEPFLLIPGVELTQEFRVVVSLPVPADNVLIHVASITLDLPNPGPDPVTMDIIARRPMLGTRLVTT